jgi:predicted phage tail protein
MKTIMLYGFLGKQFGKVHQYDVKNPAEAVRAMSATIKGFRTALIDGGSYRIVIGGQQDINLDDLAQPLSDRESIRIVPVVEGSGDVGKIILGAAIIYSSAGMAAPLFGAGGIAGTGFLTTMTGASLGMQIGSSLILGGIAELLFSPPDTTSNETGNREAASNTPSFVFDGAVNTVAQGHPVPVCYGRLIVGSQVISAGLSVEQFSTTPDVSETTYEVTEVLLYPVSPAHYIFTVEHAATLVSDTWVRQIVP